MLISDELHIFDIINVGFHTFMALGELMRRQIQHDLDAWATSGDMPLVLLGPRQVGKTWLMRELGRTRFRKTIYLNFEEDSRLASAFEESLKPHEVITRLSLLTAQSIDRETLIIFDEIQAGGRAITSLKYFHEDAPEYRVLAAGSLLGVALAQGVSFPVGKVHFLHVSPMTFREYLWAADREVWADALATWSPYDPAAYLPHSSLLEIFNQYLTVGGMPGATDIWLRDKDPIGVRRAQDEILTMYQRDITSRSSAAEISKIWEIWRSIPRQLARDTGHRFRYSDVAAGARAREYSGPIHWLEHAGIAHIIRLSEHPSVPLSLTSSPTMFKVYMTDVGLLRAMVQAPDDASASLSSWSLGSTAENYVLQSLIAQGADDVHYWHSRNQAEVDFISVLNRDVVAIEVKSGNNVASKSLAQYRKKYQPRLTARLSTRPPGYEPGLLSLPLYMADELTRIDRELLANE